MHMDQQERRVLQRCRQKGEYWMRNDSTAYAMRLCKLFLRLAEGDAGMDLDDQLCM